MPTLVAPLCEIPPGRAKVVRVDDTDVLLVNIGGEIHALGDGCLNCSASLCGARVHGDQIACPLCGWPYDVLSGAVASNARLRLDKYVVRINGTSIEVIDRIQDRPQQFTIRRIDNFEGNIKMEVFPLLHNALFFFFVASSILRTLSRCFRSCATASSRLGASIVAFFSSPLIARALYVYVGML